MPEVPIRTQVIDRDELAKFIPLKNFRLIKFFENLAQDVSTNIPAAIETSVQGPSGGSVDDNVVVFDGTTGLKVKDSGIGIDDLAPLESPAFTGIPTAPTAAPSTNTSQIATTAFVANELSSNVVGPGSATNNAIALFNGTTGKLIKDSAVLLTSLAPLSSPTLTGDPKAPTAAPGDNDTSIATTAFVTAAIAALSANASNFSAHNNSVVQSIPNGVFTKLTFSTTAFNNGSGFSTVNSRWTPPAGRPVVLVALTGLNLAANTNIVVSIFKNGAEYRRGNQIVSPNVSLVCAGVTCIDIPNGTDFYEAFVLQNSGGAQNTLGFPLGTYFQGTTIQA